MIRLRDGCGGDHLLVFAVVGRDDRTRWLEELSTEVGEVSGGRRRVLHSSPAFRCPVEHGPDERQAATLTGQSADDLHPATGLPESAFDEVGVADALPVLLR